MRSFRLAIFCSCQDNLQGICRAQCHGLRKRSMIGESVQLTLVNGHFGKVKLTTYLSLNAAAALPFPVTEITASSKFHDEAASATPAPKSSSEGSNDRRNRIVKFCRCIVEFRGASGPRTIERCLSEPCAIRLP
jgi:hypothetical protein